MKSGRVCEFGFEKPFEIVKIHRIELPEALHPDGGRAHCVGVEFAPDDAPTPFAGDEACIGEDGEVFGNGGEGHGEGMGHVGDGHVILQQHGQDRPAGGVGKGGEGGVKGIDHVGMMRVARLIVNRMVEYGCVVRRHPLRSVGHENRFDTVG
jgi:hypothetical protein